MSNRFVFTILASLFFEAFRGPAAAVDIFKAKPKPKEEQSISATAARLKEIDQATDSFAERYASYLMESIDKAVKDNPDPEARREALRLKLHATSSAFDIASGPNALGQLLDMCVLVTLGKINWVEEGRAKKVFGVDHCAPVVQSFNNAYDEIWALAGRFLTPEEVAATKKLIRSWRAKHADLPLLQDIRFDDFARARAGLEQENPAIKGLFAQLGEAARSIQSVQDFGEHTLYYVKHMPRILQFQTERTVQALFENPDVKQSFSSVSDIAGSVAHIVDRFDSEQQEMQKTLQEANKITENGRLIVSEARETSTALTGAFDAATRFMLTVNPPLAPGEEPKPASGKPFDINEWGLVFEKATVTARETRLLMDQTLALESAPALNHRIDDVEGFMKRRIDHISMRIAQLMVFFFALFFATRWACAKLK